MGFIPPKPSSSASVTDPNVAYIRSDGNDTTGDGSPSKPYLTGQPAVTAGFLAFDIGENCDAGNMTFSGGAKTISICGCGPESTINALLNPGNDLTVYAHGMNITNVSTQGASVATGLVGNNSGNLTVYGGATVEFGALFAKGGPGGDGDGVTQGGDGGAAGNIVINGPVIVSTNVIVTGGNGGADGGAGAGAAGADGSLTVKACAQIPIPDPDAATVLAAIINGVFYPSAYP